jgi:hypothetical protein
LPIAEVQTPVKPDISLWGLNKVDTGHYNLEHFLLSKEIVQSCMVGDAHLATATAAQYLKHQHASRRENAQPSIDSGHKHMMNQSLCE